jgi:hypothetical protein
VLRANAEVAGAHDFPDLRQEGRSSVSVPGHRDASTYLVVRPTSVLRRGMQPGRTYAAFCRIMPASKSAFRPGAGVGLEVTR